MPRNGRLVIPGCIHHVCLRGNNRRTLFSQSPDYRTFLGFITDSFEKTPVPIHCATLMTNHVHLVVTPPDEDSLDKFVGRFAQRYAQYRNKRRDGSGHLYDGRFYSEPLRNEAHVGLTLAYVELNPERAGLRAVDEHPWSTYACHVGRPSKFPAELWTPSFWYESLGTTIAERQQRYAAWIAERRLAGERPPQAEELDKTERKTRSAANRSLRRPNGRRAA
jgi:putative transposase